METEKLERERYSQLFEFNKGDEERTFSQFAAGMTIEDVAGGVGGGENSDGVDGGTSTKAGTFWKAVKARMTETGCGKGEAARFVVHERPELHRKFLEDLGQQKVGCQEGKGGDFMKAVEDRMKNADCSRGQAVRFVVHQFPEKYEAFLAKQVEDAELKRAAR